MKLKILSAIALVSALFMAACSDDAKEAIHNVRAAPDLQGTFHDECSSSKILDASEQIQLSFEGNQYTRSQVFFKDSECKEETGRIEYKGEFRAGEESEQNGGTLDLNVEEAKIKVSSDTLAKALNAIRYCGHTDFEVDKEVTLSGAQTEGLCPIENVPVNLYTTYKLQDGNLVLNDSDITTMAKEPNARSSVTSAQRTYVKQ